VNIETIMIEIFESMKIFGTTWNGGPGIFWPPCWREKAGERR
jgi:hypothetical protein